MRDKIKISVIVMVFLLVSLILTVSAEEKDSDLDGVPDQIDKYPFDYDNDGMPDVWEKKYSLRYDVNDANEDPDKDGIKNIDEYKQGTDPFVSEKTKERVPLELLTPVEVTMARGLIWGASILLLLLVVGFILYRVHIFRILKYLHHVSKEHFEHHLLEHRLKEYYKRKGKATKPMQPGGPITRRQAMHYTYKTGQFLPRIIQQRAPDTPKQAVKNIPKSRMQYANDFAKQQAFIPPKQTQKIVLQKPEPFEKVADIKPKREDDIFGRLSKHIQEYKKTEKLIR